MLIVAVCFGLQESEGGLYVCMNTFLGFGREHVERHYRKTGQSVYMHLKRHVREVSVTPAVSILNGCCFKKQPVLADQVKLGAEVAVRRKVNVFY